MNIQVCLGTNAGEIAVSFFFSFFFFANFAVNFSLVQNDEICTRTDVASIAVRKLTKNPQVIEKLVQFFHQSYTFWRL